MLIPVLISCSLWGHAWTQLDNTNAGEAANVQWGWQMSQAGPGTIGHYFVKLPESEQQVRYLADGSGYHGAVAVTTSDQHHIHSANFALGERALELNAQIGDQLYDQQYVVNGSETSANDRQQQTPVDIFLLQQQIPVQGQYFQVLPNNPNNIVQYASIPNYYYTNNNDPNQAYYKVTEEENEKESSQVNTHISKGDKKSEDESASADNSEEIFETKENGPVVRVFKDHNCPNDDVPNSFVNNIQKTDEVIADLPTYKERQVHGKFSVKDDASSIARSEKYYYTTVRTPVTTIKTLNDNEGISRLVASTQDLISNEDLLRINHAAEKAINSYGEDIIKPRRRSNARAISYYYNTAHHQGPDNRIRVSAKIRNIVDSNSNINPSNNNDNEESVQTTTNGFKFASPIIVDDANYNNYKEQIVNNLVSTMVPYIQDGYEIIGVRNSLDENNTYTDDQNKADEDLVNITPRPISQNYLAPITVALRLFNSNDTDFLNTVDDHETSDTEFVANTVESPKRQNTKTIVEIQEAIPIEITHINDVEYHHEYLNEGRSNKENPLNMVKSLYQKYLQSLETSNQDQNQYDQRQNNQNSNYVEINDNDSREPLDSSENIQSEVQIQANSDNRNTYANYNNAETREKIIQPIIIEKQVPVTTYVDRFIEKQVPYPERVEVVKQVPVDRPVPVPVHYETIVEKPVEVTRYVDKPYPVEVFQPFPVAVRVPYPVEHKVYVDRPVHIPYPVEKIVEKRLLHPVPVPTPVGIPIGIEVPVEKKVLYPVPIETPVPVAVPVDRPVPVEKIVEKEVQVPYPVEKKVPYPVRHEVKVPVPYPVEKRIQVPVEKIVEKPVTVTKVVEKPVHVKVPVPHPVPYEVHVPRPYPVDRIIEKKIPYPVHIDRIVERKIPVQVPYPVKTIVEKIVEKPVVVTKYVDKPYPVEKRVPYPVEKIVERKVPYPVHVPVEVKVPYPVERNVQKGDNPYPFEKPATIYSYGVTQDALANVANYIRQNQEQYKQALPNYVQNNIDNIQEQAESQRNYQIQLANAQLLKNLQNATPVYTTQWGNQYASSYHYLNSTDNNRQPTNNNYISQENDQKYYGPPPLKNSNDHWEKNNDYTERLRRTDRAPKVANLRIEYGFKPPLIPSTEVDLDGIPINKGQS